MTMSLSIYLASQQIAPCKEILKPLTLLVAAKKACAYNIYRIRWFSISFEALSLRDIYLLLEFCGDNRGFNLNTICDCLSENQHS